MGAFAAPLVPGGLDAWEGFIADLNGPRRAEFEALNARHGLTTHEAYLQDNPDGSQLVIVVTDGPGADNFMTSIGASTDPFDQWFVGKVAEAHGFDLTGPMPPLPKQLL